MEKLPVLTLRNLLINGRRCIGIQHNPSQAITSLVATLNSPRWSDEYHMNYIENTPENLQSVFDQFKGVAWINCRYFFKNRPIHSGAEEIDLTSLAVRDREGPSCPAEYIEKLEIMRYSLNTARSYVGLFEEFMAFYPDKILLEINEPDIRRYMQHIICSTL
jgi:integrase/recombinase XerD